MTTRLSSADFCGAMARGLAQIILQPSAVTGLLIFVGIVLHSLNGGIGTLVGLAAGTATAVVVGLDRDAITSGQFGYNGALVGLALCSFFEFQVVLLVGAAIGGAFSTLILAAMRKRGITAYTFPFVITTWILLAALAGLRRAPAMQADAGSGVSSALLEGIANGVGQVMFQPYVVTGLIFIAALSVSSKTAAVFGLAGSAIGMALGYAIRIPVDTLAAGLFGFNAVLCGIAFAGTTLHAALLAVSAMILATALYWVFVLLGLPALTFPFVAATWVVAYLGKRLATYR